MLSVILVGSGRVCCSCSAWVPLSQVTAAIARQGLLYFPRANTGVWRANTFTVQAFCHIRPSDSCVHTCVWQSHRNTAPSLPSQADRPLSMNNGVGRVIFLPLKIQGITQAHGPVKLNQGNTHEPKLQKALLILPPLQYEYSRKSNYINAQSSALANSSVKYQLHTVTKSATPLFLWRKGLRKE